tara:strand:- start:708 stop:887 length:180 start_codon:yes stop_codon:yes gene_type:complete
MITYYETKLEDLRAALKDKLIKESEKKNPDYTKINLVFELEKICDSIKSIKQKIEGIGE